MLHIAVQHINTIENFYSGGISVREKEVDIPRLQYYRYISRRLGGRPKTRSSFITILYYILIW